MLPAPRKRPGSWTSLSRRPIISKRTCQSDDCSTTFEAFGTKRYCSPNCRPSRQPGYSNKNTVLRCARHGCHNFFLRTTCQIYCSVNCRKADRRCPRCKSSLPADQPGTKNAYCRDCQAELARIRRSDPNVSIRIIRKYRFEKYGLTHDDYIAMLEAQNHRCAICRQPETASNNRGAGIKTLAVDHDHNTGRIRGLLCNRCNTGIGLLNDDPNLLQAAIAYLNAQQE